MRARLFNDSSYQEAGDIWSWRIPWSTEEAMRTAAGEKVRKEKFAEDQSSQQSHARREVKNATQLLSIWHFRCWYNPIYVGNMQAMFRRNHAYHCVQFTELWVHRDVRYIVRNHNPPYTKTKNNERLAVVNYSWREELEPRFDPFEEKKENTKAFKKSRQGNGPLIWPPEL